MQEIKLSVGRISTSLDGTVTDDGTKQVCFHGEELGSLSIPGYDNHNQLTDTRGTNQTLYQAEDDRLLVHVHEWSNWQGESTIYTLHLVIEEDLQTVGRFEDLGAVAGYGRPLTLDEALERG